MDVSHEGRSYLWYGQEAISQSLSDHVECDPVVPDAATRRDPTHQIKLQSNNVYLFTVESLSLFYLLLYLDS